MINWFNTLPPAVRHAVLGLLSTLAVVIALSFANVHSWEDVQIAAGGLTVTLIGTVSRFVLDLLTAPKP